MSEEFVDANVFLRFLAQDHPTQGRRAQSFFSELETGRRAAVTCEAVIAEVVHVLASKQLYNVPRPTIAAALSDILSLRALRLPDKDVCLRALDLYQTYNVDFVDVLQVAHMERNRISVIVSFDRDFDRVGEVTRREP